VFGGFHSQGGCEMCFSHTGCPQKNDVFTIFYEMKRCQIIDSAFVQIGLKVGGCKMECVKSHSEKVGRVRKNGEIHLQPKNEI